MNTNGRENLSHIQNRQREEINLQDIINIIRRRKKTIFISVFSILALAVVYNYFAPPIYESTVTLKKEVINTRSSSDGFKEMFSMQTMDELDTEIEIIKTRTVLEKIITELDILVHFQKIEFSNGVIREFDTPLFYLNIINNSTGNGRLPQFSNFDINLNNPSIVKEYYVKISKYNVFNFYEKETDYLIQSVNYDSIAVFDIEGLHFDLKWLDGKNDDKIYFEIKDFEPIFELMQNNIGIMKVGNTNIFKVSFKSKSPSVARLIANTIVEKYRENRLGQRRQSIHSSFEFVDDQLQEISGKLKNAELELGLFKSEHKITNMAESSSEIVNFLSNLESKKVGTDLELAEYRNKLKEMKKEQEKKGYIDQTYLTPGGTSGKLSPFSVLLGQLSDAKIKRLELLQKRKENHPDVITINDQIAQIKIRLSEYNDDTMTSYQIIINTLRKKQYNLSLLIKKYSSRLGNLPGQESALIELMRNKNVFEKMFTLLLDKREELRMAEFSKLQDIIIIDPARIPYKPVTPRKTLNIILGGVLGLIIGVITIFVQEFLEEKITDIDEIEKNYSTPIFSIIPKYDKAVNETITQAKNFKDRLVNLMDDHPHYLEAYRLLRTRLLNFSKNGQKVFVFTSSDPNTGKSTTVANLAVSLARIRKKVLIIDGDLKMAGLSRIFSVPKDFYSIENYLSDERPVPILYNPFKKSKSNLAISILPAGHGNIENSSELLELEKMKNLIEYAKNKFDYVLIDTPPVTRIVDPLVFGNYVQDIIFLIKPNHTFKDGVKFAFEEIEQASMNVCGIVINACNIDKSSYKYKYGYGYGYEFKE